MKYQPKLNPSRGLIIERFQPITKQDLSLIEQILNENDEAVIGVGAAEVSHGPGYVMTAGERIEVIDKTLQERGINPNKYIILPIEKAPEATQWVEEVMMMTPR